LIEEFGVTPRVGWNIDPFGHTEANAALFHDFGFDALFFSRLGSEDNQERLSSTDRGTHFLWRPLATNFGKQKEILSGLIADGNYGFAEGFKYDDENEEQFGQKATGI